MFENYSLGDFFANIYKKKCVNIILFILLSLVLVIPTVYKTVNRKVVTTDNSSYSTYIVYKIKAPENDKEELMNKFGYSEFFSKTLQSNLNGAFLFNDVDEATLERMAGELDTTVVALKNSNFDFWDKKIIVNPIPNNIGVTVKVLTTSKIVNEQVEKKFDLLVEKYKSVYENIKITKEESTTSAELGSKENVSTGYSKKKLLIKVFALEIFALLLVSGLNFMLYIFDPTINKIGDFKKYNLDFVFEVNNNEELLSALKYRTEKENIEKYSLISSNKKVFEKLKSLGIDTILYTDLEKILNTENLVIVEEFGLTRYSKFEKMLQKARSLDKNIVGAIAYKL